MKYLFWLVVAGVLIYMDETKWHILLHLRGGK